MCGEMCGGMRGCVGRRRGVCVEVCGDAEVCVCGGVCRGVWGCVESIEDYQ